MIILFIDVTRRAGEGQIGFDALSLAKQPLVVSGPQRGQSSETLFQPMHFMGSPEGLLKTNDRLYDAAFSSKSSAMALPTFVVNRVLKPFFS